MIIVYFIGCVGEIAIASLPIGTNDVYLSEIKSIFCEVCCILATPSRPDYSIYLGFSNNAEATYDETFFAKP